MVDYKVSIVLHDSVKCSVSAHNLLAFVEHLALVEVVLLAHPDLKILVLVFDDGTAVMGVGVPKLGRALTEEGQVSVVHQDQSGTVVHVARV